MAEPGILVTGAAGFVGSELVRALLRAPAYRGRTVYALVRPGQGLTAAQRLRRVTERWAAFGEPLSPEACERLKLVEHDLAAAGELPSGIVFDQVFHAAASTDFALPETVAWKANVCTTENALRLAREQPEFCRFVHLSSAFVAGRSRGLVTEERSPGRFHNCYESSKFAAEGVVRASGLPFTILRPSIILGDSRTGYTLHFRVIYSVLRMWLRGVLPRAPIDPRAAVDVVPIDYVTDAALELAQMDAAAGATLHLCAGPAYACSKEILDTAVRIFRLPGPRFISPWVASLLARRPFFWLVPYHVREILVSMRWHLPYLGQRGRVFATERSEALLMPRGITCPPFAAYGDLLFTFCRDTAWGKRPPMRPQTTLVRPETPQLINESEENRCCRSI